MKKILGLVFFGLLASSGCGGGGVALADFDAEAEAALCANAVKCGRYTTEAECKKYVDFNGAQLKATVTANKATYDADKAGDCLDAIRSQSCSSSAENKREAPAACNDFVKGKTVAGGACTDGTQCTSGSCKVPASDVACAAGTCNPDAVAAGGSCVDAECQNGLFCNEANVCATLLPIGSMCFASSECAYGSTCFGEPGVCTATAASGTSCAAADCDKVGDQCDSITKTCKTLGKEGDACEAGLGGFFACINPLFCDQAALKCAPRPVLGATCSFVCEAGGFCNQVSKKCDAKKADAAVCTGNSQCVSNNCAIPRGTQMGTCVTDQVCN